jgi:hypothetical protein
MGGWVAVECVGSVRDGQKDKGPESDVEAANLRSPGVERNLTWICIRTTAFPHLGYNGSQSADLSPSTRRHEGEYLRRQ